MTPVEEHRQGDVAVETIPVSPGPVPRVISGVRKVVYTSLIIGAGLVTVGAGLHWNNAGSGNHRPLVKNVVRQPSDHLKSIEEIDDGNIEDLWLLYTGSKGRQVQGKFTRDENGFSLAMKDGGRQYVLRNTQKIPVPKKMQMLFGADVDPQSMVRGIYKSTGERGADIAMETCLKNGTCRFPAASLANIFHETYLRSPTTKHISCRLPFEITGDLRAFSLHPDDRHVADLLFSVEHIGVANPVN